LPIECCAVVKAAIDFVAFWEQILKAKFETQRLNARSDTLPLRFA